MQFFANESYSRGLTLWAKSESATLVWGCVRQSNCRTAGREEKRAGVKEGAKPISSFLLAEVQKAQGVIIRYSVFTELQRDRGVSTKMGEDAERICSREY